MTVSSPAAVRGGDGNDRRRDHGRPRCEARPRLSLQRRDPGRAPGPRDPRGIRTCPGPAAGASHAPAFLPSSCVILHLRAFVILDTCSFVTLCIADLALMPFAGGCL